MAHVKSKGLDAALEDCEEPECRNPLNILSRVLAATMNGKMSETQKTNFLRAAKLDAWRIANCPLDKDTLGRGTWGLLHNAAINHPDVPTREQQATMVGFIEGIAAFFPCKMCSKDFNESIRKSPSTVETRRELSMSLCNQHNRVNEKLGKPAFRCEMVCLEKRWKRSNENACLNDEAEAPSYTIGDCQTDH